MKQIFLVFGLLMAQMAYGQLKGPIPQSNAPEHINKERKAEVSSPATIAKNNAEKLTKSLKLSGKQNKDLYAALLDYETNSDKINNSKLPKKEKFVKINALNKARQAKLKAIFTPEQYNTYILSFP